jgi:hypothetical protein
LKIGLLPNIAEFLTSREAQETAHEPWRLALPLCNSSADAKKLEACLSPTNGPSFATADRAKRQFEQ